MDEPGMGFGEINEDVMQALINNLAVNGGEKVVGTKLPGWPSIDERQLEAVNRVLESNKWNYWQGTEGLEFQEKFARYHDCDYGIAVSNGTAALHVALHAAGVSPGDEVIVPSYTFIASATSVLLQGALPVFADADPVTHCISPASIRQQITPKTTAIVVVHLYGHPCEMDEIMAIAVEHNLVVIEDCAHAHGATYKGRKVGSFGTTAAFSFCTEKIISTGGEGGMVTCLDKKVADRGRAFKDHGFDEDTRREMKKRGDLNLYFHHCLGNNYRLTEMQAAMGIVCLANLDDWLGQRRRNAAKLRSRLANLSWLGLPHDSPEIEHSYYMFECALDVDQLSCSRDEFILSVKAEGVDLGKGNTPENYLEELFQSKHTFGKSTFPFDLPGNSVRQVYEPGLCPTARAIGLCNFKIKVHPTRSEEHMDLTAEAIIKVGRAFHDS